MFARKTCPHFYTGDSSTATWHHVRINSFDQHLQDAISTTRQSMPDDHLDRVREARLVRPVNDGEQRGDAAKKRAGGRCDGPVQLGDTFNAFEVNAVRGAHN